MGNCKYCGESAGMLRSQHKQCQQRHDEGTVQFVQTIAAAAEGAIPIDQLESALRQIQTLHLIGANEVRGLLISGWEMAVDRAFEDGVISTEEEQALGLLQSRFSLAPSELDRTGAYGRLAKGHVIREVLDGVQPRITFESPLPFNFQKSEKVLWVFDDVDCLEQKVRREYVGRSGGVSVRVSSGESVGEPIGFG